MKVRRGLAVICTALVCALASTTGQASSTQEEQGWVLVPLPERVGAVYVGACGLVDATTTYVAGDVLGADFAVDPLTWGRPFALTPLVAASDLDISFLLVNHEVETYGIEGFNAEIGTVPYYAMHAWVCLRNGLPTRFAYRAG